MDIIKKCLFIRGQVLRQCFPNPRSRLIGIGALFILSGIIVAFGQPARSCWLSGWSAACGFSIFWIALDYLRSDLRVKFAFVWFAIVQLIQLSWLASLEFQGNYILVVYTILALYLGLQFAFFTWYIYKVSELTVVRILAFAGMWTLIEWSRFFIFCGFAFNFVGLSLSCSTFSMQMASLFGVLGMSFWVMLTNLFALRYSRRTFLRQGSQWLVVAAIPYLYGGGVFLCHRIQEGHALHSLYSVVLVQTGLSPSQKYPLRGKLSDFISPIEQWERICSYIKSSLTTHPNTIILPEAVVPLGFDLCCFSFGDIDSMLVRLWGSEIKNYYPPLQSPYGVVKSDLSGRRIFLVSNAFIAQTVANYLSTSIICGLDYRDNTTKKNYNSAFIFKKGSFEIQRYDKRILLPLAEYLPFEKLRFFTSSYGINEFFTRGNEPITFSADVRIAPSICYEELFPGLMREAQKMGVDVFVNITNDAWYPDSSLSIQHFHHGLLRAVENGIPLVRACNTGITAVVNSRGEVLSSFGTDETKSGALSVEFPLCKNKTLFSFWGNWAIVSFSLFCLVYEFIRKKIFNLKFFQINKA